MSNHLVGMAILSVLRNINITSIGSFLKEVDLDNISVSVTSHVRLKTVAPDFDVLTTRLTLNEENQFMLLISGTLALLLIILTVSLILCRSFQKKKKANEALEKKAKHILDQKNELLTKAQALEETNEKLRELSQFKESLIQMIAHDMKNPLNAIIGLASVDPSSEKNLEMIHQSGQQIMNMINNMLEVQKFEETNVSLNIKEYKLNDLIDKAIFPLTVFIEAKQIEIKTSVPQKFTILVDGELMIRVIGNLLSNAVKYSNSHSTIDVKGEFCADSKCAIVSITDYGIGIPKDHQEHIFDKYWRGNLSDDQPGGIGSTGLGLTFCKLALEAHGCSISVSSIEGSFTTFSFSLPIQGHKGSNDQNGQCRFQGPDPSLILKTEADLLSKYYEDLSHLKVHEISKIRKVMKELEDLGVRSKWKEELISATYNANQQLFYSLIKMLREL